MKLRSVYRTPDAATYLYALLTEREPTQNISHRGMPTVTQHLAFVRSNPYKEWHLIEAGREIVGAVYLTRAAEIGIFIFKAHQGRGYGKRAVQLLRQRHPGERLLANVNPANKRSRRMFEKIGGTLLQVTYAL